MSETYIPLSQVNTYVFCPRRFYYESVEGHQVVNEHVEEGKIKHEHVHTAVKDRKKGDKTISRRQYLASDTLGVSGYTDLVEEKNGIPYPVEFKKAGMGNWLNDQVQLCLQGLLLEEKLEFQYHTAISSTSVPNDGGRSRLIGNSVRQHANTSRKHVHS